MTFAIVSILKWTAKAGFVLASIVAFIGLLNFGISMIRIGLNGSVVGDLFGLMQIWLPFNMGSLLVWLVTASGLYIAYRLTIIAFSYVETFIKS